MKIGRKTVAGGAGMGMLADSVRALAQGVAKTAADAVAPFTADNSGGAASDGTMPAIPAMASTPASGASCPTKATVETALGTVRDAFMEIAAKITAIAAVVPAFTPTTSIGGTAADGTIAAIGALTGATSARVARTGLEAQVAAYRAVLANLTADVNALAVATGEDELGHSLDAYIVGDHVYAALTTDTGAAASDGTASVVTAEATAVFTAFADSIAELADKLDTIVDGTALPVTVIAV